MSTGTDRRSSPKPDASSDKQRLVTCMLNQAARGAAIDAAMIKQNGLLDLLKAAMASIRLDEEVLDLSLIHI